MLPGPLHKYTTDDTMGLFDFLKPKKETIACEGGNITVGSSKIVKDTFKGFLENYDREIKGKAASPEELAKVCYAASYMVLPSLIHERWPEFQTLWSADVPFPIYLALIVADNLKKSLSASQLNEFDYFEGKLADETIEYFLIKFPAPPPQGGQSTLDTMPVLGPYFAVALHRPTTGERWLYVLGQAPGSGTTLRSVTAPGCSGNCGPGPEPSASAFLEAVQCNLALG
jgi:hypothetical protein